MNGATGWWQVLSETLIKGGCAVVSGGTDSHLILVDLRPKNLTGNLAEKSLERAGITCNKNAIPFDPERPAVTSDIRLGTPTLTSRGMGTGEMIQVRGEIREIREIRV